MSDSVPVCPLADLADRQPVGVEVDGVPVLLVRDGDVVHALHDVCTHAEIPLSEGDVDCDRAGRLGVECWMHGSRFDLTTGEPDTPPATEPVAVFPTTVRDGQVHVTVRAATERAS